MASDETRLPDSLTELILAIPDGEYWSSSLLDVVEQLVRLERRNIGSPRHVGLDGDNWDDEKFEELACQCYTKCILGVDLGDEEAAAQPTSFDNLRTKARLEGVGTGYVRRAIQNHLRDLQRRRDPQATAVFKRITRAVAQLSDQGKVMVVPTSSRLDKHSVVRFHGLDGDVVDPPGLVRIVRRSPAREDLVHRLGLLGEDPTQEIWDLFTHLESSACAAFRIGDLLDALAELVGPRSEVPLDGLPASSESSDSEELLAADHDRMFVRMRDAVMADKCSQAMRERMLALLDARWDFVGRPDAPPLRLTALAAACGVPKQRASEAWKRLEQLIAHKFGVNLADGMGNDPSDN